MTTRWSDAVRRIAQSRRFAQLVWLAVTIAALALAFRTLRQAMRPQGFDQTAYLEAARALQHGVGPYTLDMAFPYLYPPSFAWLLIPIAWLPDTVIALLWFGGQCALLWWTAKRLAAAARALNPALAAAPVAPLVLLVAVPMFRALHANLVNGQVNLILVALGIAFVQDARRHRHARAGLWLALGILTKLTPAILVLDALVRRDLRTLLWGAAFVALLVGLPMLTHGSEFVLQCWRDFQQHVVVERGAASGPFHADPRGDRIYFTLWGLVATIAPATEHSQLARVLCAGAVAAGAALLQVLLRRRARGDGDPSARDLHAVAIYLAAILLVSPMAQKHHLGLLLPAITLGVLRTFGARWSGPPARTGLALFGAITLFLWISKALTSWPLYALAILLSIGYVAWAGWRRSPAAEILHTS
ncbi:MAG: DUF2029 domain-containing protein [Planctomycetes bacterium]|nr:DUF2029 domain-containing protein [Planctomycetota bacterium]